MKKTLSIILLAILVGSSLSLAITFTSARPWTSFGMGQGFGNLLNNSHSNRPNQQNLVRIDGLMKTWGATSVSGSLSTQARTTTFNVTDTRQMASASAIWTTNTSRPINAVRSAENFTYSFYATRLANASVSALNLENSNFFINGIWELSTVTTVVTIITDANGEIISIHRESDTAVAKAYGELSITNNWTTFTLNIEGIEPLSGSVVRSRTSLMQFNPFKFSDNDGTTTNNITKTDIRNVAKAYGAMPGWGNYDHRMDFNNNYKIDIADLATVAANLC